MELIITKKTDKRDVRRIKITGIEIHPENNKIMFIVENDLNKIQFEQLKTDYDYFVDGTR